MKASNNAGQNPERAPRSALRTVIGAAMSVLLSALIIVGALAAYRHQINTSPQVGRKKPPRQAKLVQVIGVVAWSYIAMYSH